MTGSFDGSPASDDGLQSPLVHEGGETDEVSTNELGDDKATVQQPSGDEVPSADRG